MDTIECNGRTVGPVLIVVPTVPRVDCDDVADRYAIEMRPGIPGGLVEYAESGGKWTVNPWSSRALVWTLLADNRRLHADTLRARVVGLQEAAAFLHMALTKMRNEGIEDAPAGDVVQALIEGLMARADDGFEDELSVSAKAEIAAERVVSGG